MHTEIPQIEIKEEEEEEDEEEVNPCSCYAWFGS